jgi:hypothetical protein
VGLETAAPAGVDELVRAWSRLVEIVAGSDPVGLVIEDAHWGDTELAAFLAGADLAALAIPLLVVVTARQEAIDRFPALEALEPTAVVLGALPADDATALLRAALDDGDPAGGLAADAAARLVDRAGGNPLFIGELARLLVQRRADPDAASAVEAVPDTVQLVIAARLDLLDPEIRSVARDAAVIGASFSTGSLAALARLEPGRSVDLGDALGRLTDLGFVHPTVVAALPGDSGYAFQHALVRDVAYGQLTRADRSRRHAAVAAWLADVRGADRGDLAGVIADHDLAAIQLSPARERGPHGIDPDAVRRHAVPFLVEAGEHALGHDPTRAADRFLAALDFETAPAAKLPIAVLAARALHVAGRAADARALVSDAQALVAETGDVDSAVRLQLRDAEAARVLGVRDWDQLIRGAVRMLEGRPPSMALVEACEAMTLVEMVFGDAETGISWTNRAVELARQLGLPLPIRALGRRGFARLMLADAGGLDDCVVSIAEAEARNDSNALANLLHDGALAQLYALDLGTAETWLRRAIAVARERRLGWVELVGIAALAYTLRAAGSFDEAAALLQEGEASRATVRHVHAHIGIVNQRLQLTMDRGDDAGFDRAAEAMQALVADGSADPSDVAVTLGLIAARRGDAAAVRSLIGGMYAQSEGDLMVDAYDYLAFARAAIGLAPETVEHVASMTPERTLLGAAIRATLDGLLATAVGDHELAVRRRETALLLWAEYGFAPQAALVRAELAESHAALGTSASAT